MRILYVFVLAFFFTFINPVSASSFEVIYGEIEIGIGKVFSEGDQEKNVICEFEYLEDGTRIEKCILPTEYSEVEDTADKLEQLQIEYLENPSLATRNAFYTELYNQYHKRVNSWARKHSSTNFEDIASNAFLKLLQMSPDKFDLTKSLDSYIYTIVKNESVSFHRKNKASRNNLPLDEELDATKVAINPYDEIENQLTLKNALNSLKPEQREVLELKMEGYKEAEIAERLGINAKKVKNHTYRSRKALKEYFVEEVV